METVTRGDTWSSGVIQLAGRTYAILSSTNTNPIVITTVEATPFQTGDWIHIQHEGNTGVADNNGNFQIVKIDAYSFSLTGSTGNGAGGANGTAAVCLDLTGATIETAVKTYGAAPDVIATPDQSIVQTIAGNVIFSMEPDATEAVADGRYIASARFIFPDETETLWEEVLYFVTKPTTPTP